MLRHPPGLAKVHTGTDRSVLSWGPGPSPAFGAVAANGAGGRETIRYEDLLHELTLEEKVALLSGTNFLETNPIPRVGIPGLSMADGPHGLRKQTGPPDNGVSYSE